MIYRPLSHDSLHPSLFTFGCWPLGGKYWGQIDVPQIERAIHAALEIGITCFDTAPLYGDGLADQRLAKALGHQRHNVIIATKVGARTIGAHAQSDLSASFVRLDVEQSLKRLDIESIPLLQVHWPCEQGTPLEETFGALCDLQQEGKIQHIGICNYTAADVAKIQNICPIVSLQTPYSMIRREFELELQPICQRYNIGVLAYEGLCRGLLSGKYRVPPTFSPPDLRAHDPRFKQGWF